MNYNDLNKMYDFWRKTILPRLKHVQNIISFDDYLKKFAYLPSGKWLKDAEKIKLARVPFAINMDNFTEKYVKECVAYNSPSKPEDGFQRAVYQISPTLHMEAAFWVWVENDQVQSYMTAFCCYHDEKEYLKFLDGLYELRMEGNTEDSKKPKGFAEGVGFGQKIS